MDESTRAGLCTDGLPPTICSKILAHTDDGSQNGAVAHDGAAADHLSSREARARARSVARLEIGMTLRKENSLLAVAERNKKANDNAAAAPPVGYDSLFFAPAPVYNEVELEGQAGRQAGTQVRPFQRAVDRRTDGRTARQRNLSHSHSNDLGPGSAFALKLPKPTPDGDRPCDHPPSRN